ncbi:MAG: Tol-Pal system beta propeller repeat protein TolB [Sphingomicrobium sp.]
MIRFAIFIAALLPAATPALAQTGGPAITVVAVPPLTTPDTGTKGNETLAIAWQATQLIASDLRATSDVMPLPSVQKDYYSFPEVTAPTFTKWRAAGAKALLTGFVQSRADGRLTFGFYAYDTVTGREVARKGFVVAAGDWRRAAHKCAGLAYTAATGEPGVFDTRIAYVAESGAGAARVRRVAVMDSDGFGHNFLTAGETLVLSPRLSPAGDKVAFVSYVAGKPTVIIANIETKDQRPIVAGDALTFAPRFSPDGARLAFSMMLGPNSDIYVASANGGPPIRLTTSPGIDTAPAFSPDGRQILFESDRSGSPQIYVMNVDGSDQRRVSFGGGWYSAPEFSPDGKSIAFARRGSDGLRVGVMGADGSAERVLTSGPNDDSPVWGANSRDLLFQRIGADGRSAIFRLTSAGGAAQKLVTPQDGSDPDWSAQRD